MRLEPITDPDGDRIAEQERRDRIAEKASDPSIWLGPTHRCPGCGCIPVELTTGRWVCACDLPAGVKR